MRRILLYVFILISAQSALGQVLNYSVIGTNNGLPSSEVYDILQDKQGYLWFATDHGVARYNGKEFTTYTTADGLPDNTILRMCEDRKGRIWFASHTNELTYWENNRFNHTPASDTLHKKLVPSSVIWHLYVDDTDHIWVGALLQTIMLTPVNDNYTSEIIYLPMSNTGTNFRLFCIDGKKTLIGGRLPELPRSNNEDKIPEAFQSTFDSHCLSKVCYQSVEIAMRNILIPMQRSAGAVSKTGTYYFSSHNFLFIMQKGKETIVKKLEHKILSLHIDNKNGLWIGFNKGGVAYYKNCDLESPPLRIIENYSVDAVCRDHEGGTWLATLEKGVLYVPSTSVHGYSNVPYLNDHIIFMTNVNGKIYLNTLNNVICKEENQSFVPDDYLMTLSKTNGPLAYMASIGDTTYLGFNYKLLRLAPKLILTESRLQKKHYIGGADIITTTDHAVWKVSVGSLRKWNNGNDTLIYNNSPARITKALPMGNTILTATKKGLYLFDNGKFIHLGYENALFKHQISDMIMDKNGTVWIATSSNGLLQMKGKKVIQLTEKDGLISNSCNTVASDRYGNIWLGTNKGLSCLIHATEDQKHWSIKNITEQNGLSSNEITKLIASGSTLWVGTMWGLCAVQIPEINQTIAPSPIYFSSIRINNFPVENRTTFPYNQNNLKLSLHGLTFKDKSNHRYRYRLKELDTLWQETKSDEIVFNNLAPGVYTFEAQVANTDNIWSAPSASYSFTINKPFWLTWWFILIEILVLIGVIHLIIRWRTLVIKKKEAEKLRINKLLSEYQMKALTAQMNPHFIFNAISSIQNFVLKNHSILAYDYLSKFSKLIRLVLNNSNEQEISIQQELDTLAIYIELEQLRFKDSFQYKLIVEPQLELDSLMIPSLLLQPYIENAIWHGLTPLKTQKGMITLSIKEEENRLLKISITDNGAGRKASDQLKTKIRQSGHRSVGMELTGKRIELFGQENKFSIQLIDNYDESNNPTGTTVEIILPMIEMY